MPAPTLEYHDEAERLGLEQAIAFFTRMRQVARTAPDGTAPAAAAGWDQRELAAPSIRSAIAAVEEASAFGGRCAAEARRPGLENPTLLSVAGDGAGWIRNQPGRHFPVASETLDVFHGTEHVAGHPAEGVCLSN